MFKYKNLHKIVLLLAVTLSMIFTGQLLHAAQAAQPKTATAITYSDNEVWVKLSASNRGKIHEDSKDTGIASINDDFRGRNVKKFERVAKPSKKSLANNQLFDWYKVSLDPNAPSEKVKKNGKLVNLNLEDLKAKLKKNPAVVAVEDNNIVHVSATPNDTYYNSFGSWGGNYSDMWGLKRINPEGAWDVTTGAQAVVVADIDTGVDINNSDLAANIWTNTGEISGDGIDNDGNGFVDDVHGWNFSSQNNNVDDDNGHGTHTAGIIAATGNNGTGVVGVNWTSSLMALKFMDRYGNGYIGNAAQALIYAADNGARVSSNSWGCGCHSQMLDDAIKYEHDRNMVTVVAAGNGYNSDALDTSPASSDGSITVGSVGISDQLSISSNNGPRIDVVAPGEDILSIKATNGTLCSGSIVVGTNYCRMSGTSQATPFVSGLAALTLAHNPNLSNEDVRQLIRTTAQDIGAAGRDNSFGYGIINVTAAVTQSQPTASAYISSPSSRSALVGSSPVNITGSASGSNFAYYKVEIGQGRNPSNMSTLVFGQSPVSGGTLAVIDPSSLNDGTYTIRLTTTDTNGKNYVYELYDLTVDNIAASLSQPLDLVPIGQTKISGTALGKNGTTFASYKLEYGTGSNPQNWISAGIANNIGSTPTNNNVLSNWDTSSLIDGQQYTLRLTATLSGGASKTSTILFTADKNLLSGWPIKTSGVACGSSCEGTPAFADLNGDGQKELIVASPGGNKVYAYYKDGSQVAGFPVTVDASDWFKWPVSVADVNSDGRSEIIVSAIAPTGNSHLYIIDHSGNFLQGWPNPTFELSGSGYSSDITPTIADLDGDGVKEIVTLNMYYSPNNAVMHTLHAMHADGTEITGFPKELPIQDIFVQSPLTIADLDKDGHPEIAVGSFNKFYLFDNQGNLLPGWPYQTSTINGLTATFQGVPSVGDIDGDGQSEIFSTAAPMSATDIQLPLYGWKKSGTLVAGFPQQTGQFGSPRSGSPLNNTATVDINKDGKDEVVVGLNNITIHTLNGLMNTLTANGSGMVTLSDFMGDGTVKISGGNGSGQDASQVLSTDGTVFYRNSSATTHNFLDPFVSADMDSNGQLEYATIQSQSTGSDSYIYLWQMPSVSSGSYPINEWPMFGQNPAMTNHFVLGSKAINDVVAPTVELTSPVNGSTLNGQVSIAATANDNFAVTKVEFYVDGVLKSTANTSPYSYVWDSRSLPNGTHTMLAKAYDAAGNIGTSTATISTNNPDTTPPSVTIVAPLTGTTVSESVSITTSATDNVAVAKVEFYIDGTLKSTSINSPYGFTWASRSVANGSHIIMVKAYDAANNSATYLITVDVNNPDLTPPTVVLNSPTNGTTLNGVIGILATANDDIGVTRVEFYIDGTLKSTLFNSPYGFSWDSKTVANGTHIIMAKAYDAANNSATRSATVAINNPDLTAPSLSLVSPLAGATVSEMVNVTASAADNVAVIKVEFYVDGTLSSTSTVSPYGFTWASRSVVNGSHAIMAKAYDAANNTTSSSVTVTVNNSDIISPTIAITAPLAGSNVNGVLSITTSASDNITVAKVEIYVDGTIKSTINASPYTYSWDSKTVANGSHTIMAKAYDTANNSTTSSVAVTVNNPDITPPTVSITAPLNNSLVTHSTTVAIKANATDNLAVTKVEFYINNALTCTSTIAPYSCNFKVSSKTGVSYTFQAKAYDAAGNTTSSSVLVKTK